MDMSSLVRPAFVPEAGDLWPAISALDSAKEILCNANSTPDEGVQKDLIAAVRKTLQNVDRALADPEEDTQEDSQEEDE